MVKSGTYIPDSKLLATASGGVDRRQAEAMWEIVCAPEKATKNTLRDVFFASKERVGNRMEDLDHHFNPQRHNKTPQEMDAEGYWERDRVDYDSEGEYMYEDVETMMTDAKCARRHAADDSDGPDPAPSPVRNDTGKALDQFDNW